VVLVTSNGSALSRANPHAKSTALGTHAGRVGVGCSAELAGATLSGEVLRASRDRRVVDTLNTPRPPQQ